MWQPGDVIAWRGIFNESIWHIVASYVVHDSSSEIVMAVLPGAECWAQSDYANGNKSGKRRWDFKDKDWQLEKFAWRTNRMLSITEPEKYYSIILFWDGLSNEFIGYYVNFQVPFHRNHCGIDSLDLDLDIVIAPDLSYRWKDVDDYQQAIDHSLITSEWLQGIEAAKPEVFGRLEKGQYPFDGSWLDWKPDPAWIPPLLPKNWDKI